MPWLTSEDIMDLFQLILTSCLKAQEVLLLVLRREVRDFKSQRVSIHGHFPLLRWSGPRGTDLMAALGSLVQASGASVLQPQKWILLTTWIDVEAHLCPVSGEDAADWHPDASLLRPSEQFNWGRLPTLEGICVLFKTAITCASSQIETRYGVFLCPFH